MKCEGCKYPGEVHEDTKLCQDCTEKIKKSNLRPG